MKIALDALADIANLWNGYESSGEEMKKKALQALHDIDVLLENKAWKEGTK